MNTKNLACLTLAIACSVLSSATALADCSGRCLVVNKGLRSDFEVSMRLRKAPANKYIGLLVKDFGEVQANTAPEVERLCQQMINTYRQETSLNWSERLKREVEFAETQIDQLEIKTGAGITMDPQDPSLVLDLQPMLCN